MSLQDITITSSIRSTVTQSYDQRTYIASTEEQSFPIETITGSYAGVWPNFKLKGLTSTDSASNTTVNLIVNITQSWSGSNTSISGSIPFIHDTMDEFINGEFSGSNYVVTNGILNDAQCEQFLTVNTIPTNYNIFPYSIYRENGVIQGISQFGIFINELTIPPNGGILLFKEDDDFSDVPPTVKYVKVTYLKISRFDKEGNDNTLSLQELTEIRWIDSSAGLVDLKVLNITEYPTYYLYKVSSKIFVDPPFLPGDDNILNYSLSASFNGTSASAGLYYLDKWIVHNTSSGNFSTYYYTFNPPSPNIVINYSASITATNYNASSVTFDFGFWENTYNGAEINYNPIALTQSITIPPSLTKTFTLSGLTNSSFIGNSAVQYHLETNNLNAPISLSNTFWIVTHSVAPQTSTSSVVLEPYLLSNFANSDCDVLMNNYNQNDISGFYQEVLYDNGGTVPSNLQQIISGTAQYAEINDYIHNAHANVIPRYSGVRTTSANINLPSTVGFSNEELSNLPFSSNLNIDNGVPNVTNLQTYFAYFDYLQDTTSELINKSAAHILYLIDKDGNIQIPTLTGSYYWNLIDNFETDKFTSNVIVEGEEGNRLFLGTKRIIRPGVIPRAVLYSQTGSGYNIQSPISFINTVSNTAVPNYISKFGHEASNQTIGYNTTDVISFATNLQQSPEINLNPGTGTWTINTTTNLTSLKFTFKGVFFLSNPDDPTTTTNYFATLTLQKSTDNGSNWFDIASTPYWSNYYDGISTRYNYWTPNILINPVAGDMYRFQFYNPSGYFKFIFFPNTTLEISQNPPPSNNNIFSPYWIQSANNIINGPSFGSIYTSENPLTQFNIINSGYKDLLPFIIYPNDQIRFEGDENQVYNITKVYESLLTSSNFDINLSNWTSSGTGWSVAGGIATHTGTTTSTIYQGFTGGVTVAQTSSYILNFTVSNYYTGGLGFFLTPFTPIDDIIINGNGNYTFEFNSLTFGQTGIGFRSRPFSYPTLDYFSGSISNIQLLGPTSSLFLELDRDIVSGTDLNSFLIRRFNPHPNYVVLDSPVISGSGYLLPQYTTDELKQNFDNIIVSLRERSLI